jgi:heat-inducible transcriptional repressor
VLSALTSLAGVVTLPRQPHVTLRHIEFLPLSGQRVLAILVVNDAEVQNRILDMPRDYSDDELRRAANYLNQHFTGRDISDVRARLLDDMDGTRESMNRLMLDTIAVADKGPQSGRDTPGYVLSGETQLMNFHELSDVEKIKHLFEAFGEQREILTLLDRSLEADGVQIFIGEESGYRMLDNCTIVAAPYSVDEHIVGVLGVIGPTRMAYERVIPIVDITARLVGAALNSTP